MQYLLSATLASGLSIDVALSLVFPENNLLASTLVVSPATSAQFASQGLKWIFSSTHDTGNNLSYCFFDTLSPYIVVLQILETPL